MIYSGSKPEKGGAFQGAQGLAFGPTLADSRHSELPFKLKPTGKNSVFPVVMDSLQNQQGNIQHHIPNTSKWLQYLAIRQI